MKHMKKKGMKIKMFEDRTLTKFVYVFLGFISIIIPGPIVPLVSLIITIAMLVYKIKSIKEGTIGFEEIMLDIIAIIIVIVINIAFFAVRISVENEYNSSEEITIEELVETTIDAYKLGNLSQFTDDGNHQSKIKTGFTDYLKNDIGISDVTVSGNKITCDMGTDTIVFTITKNNIKYAIE